MKTLRNFEVAGGMFRADGVTPAMVGDTVRLFLDQDNISTFPEYISGTIVYPVTAIECGSKISYNIEYDVGFIVRTCDVVDWEVTADVGASQADLDAEASAREAADNALSAEIDAEASAREAADNALSAEIDAEASAREAADNALSAEIDAEASAREAADDLRVLIADTTTTGEHNKLMRIDINGAVLTEYYRTLTGSVFANNVLSLSDGTNSSTFIWVGSGADRSVTIPDQDGTLVLTTTILDVLGVTSYADLTAANAALDANSIFYNTALSKLDITTA